MTKAKRRMNDITGMTDGRWPENIQCERVRQSRYSLTEVQKVLGDPWDSVGIASTTGDHAAPASVAKRF